MTQRCMKAPSSIRNHSIIMIELRSSRNLRRVKVVDFQDQRSKVKVEVLTVRNFPNRTTRVFSLPNKVLIHYRYHRIGRLVKLIEGRVRLV